MRISDWSSDVCSSDLITPCVISSSRQRPPLAGRTAQCFYSMEGLCAFSHASFVNMGNPCRSLNDLSCRPTACPGPLEIIAAEPSSHVYRRSEEHTSELHSLMRISSAVFCLKKNKNTNTTEQHEYNK